jgi:hypothetical protein
VLAEVLAEMLVEVSAEALWKLAEVLVVFSITLVDYKLATAKCKQNISGLTVRGLRRKVLRIGD